ncbi:MAG: hypothetical protein ABI880_04710 [Acidobacteriota bacterium]
MCHDHFTAKPAPPPAFAPWPAPQQWCDVSADQADGFAPATDFDLPDPDLNDDTGYGFGV